MSLAFSFTKTPQISVYKVKTSPARSNLLGNPSKSHIGFGFRSIVKPSTISIFTGKTHKFYQPKPLNSITSMFTGIVEEIGEVKQIGITDHGGFDLEIRAKTVIQGVNLGDSISVNGTCLTVTEFETQLGEFKVGVSPETLRKTSLSELEPGSRVNLERALLPTTRMGGHFVQGHVDGTGEIIEMKTERDSLWVKVKVDKSLLKYVVPKGFIAVDGTSLTVVDVCDEEECFNFMLVAYTQENVVIPLKKVGQKVNLEVDVLGKYVERLLGAGFLHSSSAKLQE